ncbi:phytoene desaturase family protein [Lichenifustis flavocetrariae]|uniref:Pyridine nucleotide-disulfide oxidoreductase domain-containing protein 2 n=1 Tax=Lichenifustis flavocetrariae TaxID=2949735 RepID=A0AA41YWP4_9HYPH|nr:NAD(P)/FAD-dependent oxidoreductase [Lichenifustis flavocetrariae]MCW6509966.1 NAD(P)/FAD-dependent oxidoreductase [Lichenifustis flavocetrariae]
MTYDAIVIGAGHNGLAAAVHLATRGWKVAVFEAAKQPGGAIKTAEVTRPGFRHDLYAMNLSLFAGSPFFASHKEGLLRHGLAFVPAPDSFATAFPDGTWLGVSQDLETTASRIAALSQKDATAWRAMAAGFAADAPHIFAVLGSPMPSRRAMQAVWGAFRAKGMAGLGELARLLVASPRDFLDRHFESPKLKAMMAMWGLHLDFPPDAAGGALFPYLESMACQSFGMVIGHGGADTIVKALTGYLRERGGEVHLEAPIVEILRTGKAATGVRLADGRTVTARRAVIANVHPGRVFGQLLPGTDHAAYRTKLDGFKPGPATMMIHYALSRLPEWAAGGALKRFAYVHLAPDFAAMTRVYDQAKAGLLPEAPGLVVGQPTALDPSRAPEGQHVLWVQVRVLPATILGDAAGEIEDTDWGLVKDRYADRVEALIERYAPGFRTTVRGRAVLSPADLERDNPNLVGGDSLSGSHHLDQNFMFRPVFGWSRYKTPVEKLFLVGASTWPGAGVGAGSGFILAKMLAGR